MRARLKKKERIIAAALALSLMHLLAMAGGYALVNWKEEDKSSVIPAKWILEPEVSPATEVPFDGICRWTSAKARYPATILELSGMYLLYYTYTNGQ